MLNVDISPDTQYEPIEVLVPPVSKCKLFFYTAVNVLSYAGFIISLPLFMNTFKVGDHNPSPYFVSMFSMFVTTLIFIFVAIYRKYKYDTSLMVGSVSVHIQMALIALVSMVSFIFLTNSSIDTRTPVNQQSLLAQLYLPFTVILTKYVKRKTLKNDEVVGITVVFVGIIFTLVPIFISISDGGALNGDNLLWCIFYVLSILTMAMVCIGEDIFLESNKFVDVLQLIVWINIYQFLFNMLFFWTNFIPWFGTSDSYSSWATEISFDINWFFQNSASVYYSIIFIGCNVIVYVTSVYILKIASANYLAVAASLTAPTVVTFWLLFPSLNTLHIYLFEAIMDYGGMLLMFGGIYRYVTAK